MANPYDNITDMWKLPTWLNPTFDFSDLFKVKIEDPYSKYLKSLKLSTTEDDSIFDVSDEAFAEEEKTRIFGEGLQNDADKLLKQLQGQLIANIGTAVGQSVLSLANKNPSNTNKTLKKIGGGLLSLQGIPVVGQYAALAGTALNMFGDIGDLAWGHTVSNFNTNKEMDALAGSSYLGSQSLFDERASHNGETTWGKGADKNDDKLYTMLGIRDNLLQEADDLRKRAQGSINAESNRYAILSLGINPLMTGRVLAAKQGTKFVYEETPEIVEYEFVYRDVDKFQKGGTFNIIPEGALHARKHNIDMEGITHKGIPVISEDEGGKILQQAEIEHSEIIFRISVTLKLEELAKEFEKEDKTLKEKDEVAIEAGKLLVQEILYNTDDRINLINNGE